MKKLLAALSKAEVKGLILLIQPILVFFLAASVRFVPINQWMMNITIIISLLLNIVFMINLVNIKNILLRVFFILLFLLVMPFNILLLGVIEIGMRNCEIVSIISSSSVHYACSTISGETSNYIVNIGELTMEYFTP